MDMELEIKRLRQFSEARRLDGLVDESMQIPHMVGLVRSVYGRVRPTSPPLCQTFMYRHHVPSTAWYLGAMTSPPYIIDRVSYILVVYLGAIYDVCYDGFVTMTLLSHLPPDLLYVPCSPASAVRFHFV